MNQRPCWLTACTPGLAPLPFLRRHSALETFRALQIFYCRCRFVADGVRRLHINKSLTRWKRGDDDIPVSVCSEPCPAGHVQKVKGSKCCWVCIQCREYEMIIDDDCLACPIGTFPTSSAARNVCEPLPIEYMSIDSVWAIAPVVFSVIGIAPAFPSATAPDICSRVQEVEDGVVNRKEPIGVPLFRNRGRC